MVRQFHHFALVDGQLTMNEPREADQRLIFELICNLMGFFDAFDLSGIEMFYLYRNDTLRCNLNYL